MSCADVRLQIDRQPRISDPDAGAEFERIRAHARSCPECAAHLGSVELLEQRLLELPEIEPGPEFQSRVMERLDEQVGERAARPEAGRGGVPPLLQQLLGNLGVLLACVGLLAGLRADLPAYLLRKIGLSTSLFLRLSDVVTRDPAAMIVAVACLLLVLSILTGPRAVRVRSRVHR